MNPPNHLSLKTSSSIDYTQFLITFTRKRVLNPGKILHAHLITTGVACFTHYASKLITFYVDCQHLDYAHKLFDTMPETNIHRWISLIGAYARRGYNKKALEVFQHMHFRRLSPNRFVVPSVLKACGHMLDVENGEKIHCMVLKHSFQNDLFVVTALIDMYSKCGDVEKAAMVFDEAEEKDLVAVNALVSGLAQGGLVSEALRLVEEMRTGFGVMPNVITWNTLIAGFSQKGDRDMVTKVFELMQIDGFQPDQVTWTSVISGLVHNFCNEEAFMAFKQMLVQGLVPSSVTISSILPASSSVANAGRGREIHGYAVVTGAEDDIYVKSALVDMYSKCGFISQAKTLFYKMTARNTVSWNSMIFGYANHGYCTEAIELFNQMEEENKLDHLSFTAVLTACSHAGLVDLGQSLFHKMQEKYNINPRLEHYACMVDLLGRAGRLTEAYDLIKTMPSQPDLFVWGAFLGACKSHGNIELAELAATHLSELEPGNAANNLLLTQIYADAGSWNNVTRLKKMMKKKRLRKLNGCSWIEA